MKSVRILTICFMAFGLMLCSGRISEAGPMGTAFTYQGHLYDANYAANGLYDFQFKLYDDPCAVSQIGSDVNVADLDVIDAYFTVELDFGSDVFDGNAVWLEIGIRPGELEDPNGYTVLSPRQEVTPTPYALYAKTAGSGDGDSDWIISGNDMYSGLSGNVGIGITSPFEKLDVNGHINTYYTYKICGNTVLSVPGTGNTLVGLDAGAVNTGNNNTFSGYQTGYSNTAGYGNTFTGYGAGHDNTTGYYNTFSGSWAGYSNTEGHSNVFSGSWAGLSNTTGVGNTFSGHTAGYYNTEGSNNTFSGCGAGTGNTTGNRNTFTGYGAGNYNTTGSNNSAVGTEALLSNTAGHDNSAMGHQALYSNTSGYQNSAMGAGALYSNTTGFDNSAMGDGALVSNEAGYQNSAVGRQSLYSNTGGNNNSAMGHQALYSNTTGGSNSAMGRQALYSNTTAVHNSAFGGGALYNNTIGYSNTAVGSLAGHNNTIGSRNVFLGHAAGYNETGSNKLYIANSEVNPPLIYGDFSTGRVGIGTTSPAAKLEVSSGDIKIGSANNGLLFYGGGERIIGTSDWGIDFQTQSGTSRMTILNNGNVGIGTINPQSKLSVGGDGYDYIVVYANGTDIGIHGTGNHIGVFGDSSDDSGNNYGVWASAGSTGSNNAIGVYSEVERDGTGTYFSGYFTGSTGGGTYNGLYADLRTGDAIDLAEYILDTKGDTEAGDVLIADPDNDESVIKSSIPYDSTVVGIVSTDPHLLMGMELVMDEQTGEKYEDVNAAKLALAGRVPVKVTDENGPIKRGDLLTTSSKPGYAMKWTLLDVSKAEDFDELKSMLAENQRRRNAVVGKALGNLDSGDGEIVALVNLQ